MAKIEIDVDDDMLAKLQRLAAKDGLSVEGVAAHELKKALDRQPRYLDYPLLEGLKDLTYAQKPYLSAIAGYIKLRLKANKGELDESRQKILQEMEKNDDLPRNLENFIELHHTVYTLLKIELNDYQLMPEQENLSSLVAIVQNRFQGSFSEKVSINIPENLRAFTGDAGKLTTALIELLIDYCINEKMVITAFDQGGENLIIQISIFSKFPIDKQYIQKRAGYAIAKYFIEMHNGELTIDSPNDKELIFIITLPISQENNNGDHTN